MAVNGVVYKIVYPDPTWVTAAQAALGYPVFVSWLESHGAPGNVKVFADAIGSEVASIVRVRDNYLPIPVADDSGTIEAAHTYVRANF
jgi:hypothetical protein